MRSVPIVMARMPVTFLSGSFAATVEKTPPLKKRPPTLAVDQSSTNLRRPKVAGRICTSSYHAADTHLARARARTHACTYARNPPAYLSYIIINITPSSVYRARVCVCVYVCARARVCVLPFFFQPRRPRIFRAFDFRSAFTPRVHYSHRLRRCTRCASAVVRQPRLLNTDGGGGEGEGGATPD